MDIAKAIKSAWAAVEESGVPEHLQEAAFTGALRALLVTGQPTQQATPHEGNPGADDGGVKPASGAAGGEAATVDEDAMMAAVSEHTGVSTERLEKIFHLDNGIVKLLVNHTALGNNAADKTRAAAQIITVVRKIGLGQADTAFDVIRDECDRKHFYDSKNFASKHLPTIEGFAVKGDGKNRRLEARNGGISAFPALIDRVLGES